MWEVEWSEANQTKINLLVVDLWFIVAQPGVVYFYKK